MLPGASCRGRIVEHDEAHARAAKIIGDGEASLPTADDVKFFRVHPDCFRFT